MSTRIFQHENEHMNGYIFTDLVSKMKLDRAKKAQAKLIKQTINRDIVEKYRCRVVVSFYNHYTDYNISVL